jgi:hypothetical protein
MLTPSLLGKFAEHACMYVCDEHQGMEASLPISQSGKKALNGAKL